jgi:hypothetical protein
LKEGDRRWRVPTPEEVSAAEQTEDQRTRGPISWVRKLRLRAQVGARRSMAKAPSVFPTPPAPEGFSDVPKQSEQPGDLPPSSISGVEGSRAERDGHNKDNYAVTSRGTQGAPKRQIRIGEAVRDRRTGRSGPSRTPVAPVVQRKLFYGHEWGRCTCGEMFYGPRDAITYAFGQHQCGVSRGNDGGDWVFDR